jgi:hypothetical protein
MIALKGKSDIGDKINTQIIAPLIDANSRLARSDFPNFNDPEKLGKGPALVERLSNLIGIFQSPTLDFSKNRAEHDDILGDAYEYHQSNSQGMRALRLRKTDRTVLFLGRMTDACWSSVRSAIVVVRRNFATTSVPVTGTNAK